MKQLLFVLTFLFLAQSAFASTHTAASCSQTDVQAAFTAATESGAVVEIPTTSSPCHWTTNVSWSAPANATLKCLSTINNSFNQNNVGSPPNDGSVTIVDDRNDQHDILTISGVSGTFRMYGCTIEKGSGTVKDSFGLMSISGTTNQFRFDHNRINLTTGTPANDSGIKFNCVLGVVDHNQFDLASNGTGNGTKVGGCSDGNEAWAAATGFGSAGGADYLTFEDNWYPAIGFSGGSAHSFGAVNDCDHGGKQVFRFNRIGTTDTSVGGGASLQTHPTGGSGVDARGCRASEFYNNIMLGNSTHSTFGAVFLSSGSAMIWNNPAPTGYEHFATYHSMRKDNNTYAEGATLAGWSYCGPTPQSGTVNTSGTTVTKVTGSSFNVSWPVGASDTTMMIIAGSPYKIASVDSTTQVTLGTSAGTQTGASYVMGSLWDENSNTLTGGRCLDQPGNGIGDLLTGAAPNKVNHDRGDLPLWPRQALEPVYEWMNTPYACSGCDHADFLSVYEPSVLVNDEEYYVHTGLNSVDGHQTSASSPFDGTTGTGWGTLANRPTTCTTGVGYGVSDAAGGWNDGSNSFYTGNLVFQKCTSTNTWTTIYTPYTYPHPLVSGAIASITSLTPAIGAQGATSLSVAVVGSNTNFVNATTVCDFGVNITVNSCTVISATALTANITIAGGAAIGARDATFTTGGEVATATSGFTVSATVSGSGGGARINIRIR